MIQIDLQQLQAELPTRIEQVEHGETIVVCRDAKPIAEIRPIPSTPPMPRPLGLGAGLVTFRSDCFDPLPPDILAGFTGEDQA